MGELHAPARDDAADCRYLLTPTAIRERSQQVLAQGRADVLSHWRLREERLPELVERVLTVTRAAYPDLSAIPYHSRWRHFAYDGVDRAHELRARTAHLPAEERLASEFDLVMLSVLLDAGAGSSWHYRDARGQLHSRSEGLAVASYELFMSGQLSGRACSLRVDAEELQRVDTASLATAFQVSADNPLLGLDGRAELLRALGRVVRASALYFGSESPRLGSFARFLAAAARDGQLDASFVLSSVLSALGPIWPGREVCQGTNLGDVWRHSQFGLVPFHKLSLWLCYSLFEPLEAAGIRVLGIEQLTGLAEYRNGGLFMDAGVLALREPAAAQRVHDVGSDLVIEWRALSLALLDETAERVRSKLGLSAAELPLARVLEGGTWRAGRAIALEKRVDGSPPLRIVSDGTVF